MSNKPGPFEPFTSPSELAQGKRRMLLSLAATVVAVVLAVVADRVYRDDRLVAVFTGAALLWFIGAIGMATRWSATDGLEGAE